MLREVPIASRAYQFQYPNRAPLPLSIRQAENLVAALSDGRGESVCRRCLPTLFDVVWNILALFPAGQSNEKPSTRLSIPDAPKQAPFGSRYLLSNQVVTRIKAIITSKDEAKLADYLSGEAAQTFIDVVHEVCTFLDPQGRR